MIQVQVTCVNETTGNRFYELDWRPAFTEDIRELYRYYQIEYGRCVSRIYVDIIHPNQPNESIPVGWVFEKLVPYDNSKLKFKQRVWVSLREAIFQPIDISKKR